MRTFTALCLLCVLALTIAAEVSEEKKLYAAVGECPEVDGEFPVYLPDSHNNTIFYECNRGIPWPLNCPPKTIFDPKLKVCVHDKTLKE